MRLKNLFAGLSSVLLGHAAYASCTGFGTAAAAISTVAFVAGMVAMAATGPVTIGVAMGVAIIGGELGITMGWLSIAC